MPPFEPHLQKRDIKEEYNWHSYFFCKWNTRILRSSKRGYIDCLSISGRLWYGNPLFKRLLQNERNKEYDETLALSELFFFLSYPADYRLCQVKEFKNGIGNDRLYGIVS